MASTMAKIIAAAQAAAVYGTEDALENELRARNLPPESFLAEARSHFRKAVREQKTDNGRSHRVLTR